jgi:hypothetical protein
MSLLMINVLSNVWQLEHVTIDLFEVTETIGQTLARSLTKLLDKYGFKERDHCLCKK